MSLFYFTPQILVQDIVEIKWEAPTKVEEYLLKNLTKKMWAEMGRETGVRTMTQNSALHLWFTLVADELNQAGMSPRKVLEKTIELSWTPELIKEMLWRPVQKAMLGKKSTTNLDKTTEINKVYEHLNRFLGEECEIHVPFPSDELKDTNYYTR